ncbi:hypothetical protein A5627_05740 [Mycobacterium colombiense]|nr:hypothetical protein A5627_05740 [Mycobacterium colombiense]
MNTIETFDPFEIDIPFGTKEPATVQVFKLPKSIHEPALADRRKLVTFGEKNWTGLSKSDLWSIAHATADPAAAVAAAQAGALIEQFAGESSLTFLHADVNLTSLFPLIQPRTADIPTMLAPPKRYGVLDGGGDTRPVQIIVFQSWAHLREYMKHSIATTLKAGRDLRSSILSHGVSQSVLCYAATILIEDTAEEINVVIVVDGLTRVIMSWWAMLGAQVTNAQLPAAIVDHLLAKKGAGGAEGVTDAYRKGRAEAFSTLRGKYQAAAGDTSDPDLTRYGQTLRLPANVIVDFQRMGKPLSGDARLYEFPDAVNSAVAQQHSLSKAWAPSAIGANIGAQAVQRAAAEGQLSPQVAEIALGIEDFSFDAVDLMDPDTGVPETDPALARGLWLSAELTQPAVFGAIKRNLRALGGDPQIHKRAYAERMSSIINRGWSAWKPESFGNAQRAWAAGGAIPHSLMGEPWKPLFPHRYSDLVPIALDADDRRRLDAVATLQCAGGMALVADGQIMAASGSIAEGGKTGSIAERGKSRNGEAAHYRRSQPPVVIDQLAKTTEGLWLLAHAADSFHSKRQAVNAFSKLADVPDDAYRINFPQPNDPEVPIEKTADGVRLNFDQVRDIAGLRLTDNDDQDDNEPVEDDHDRMVSLRSKLTCGVENLEKVQTQIDGLIKKRSDLRAFDDYAEWDAVRDQLTSIFSAVVGWKPPEQVNVNDDENADFSGDFADETEAS